MHLERRLPPVLLVLRDDLSPEDTAMLQALYSRSSESVLTHLSKIDAERRETVRAFLSEQFTEFYGGSVYDKQLDRIFAMVRGDGASARAQSLMSRHYVGYGHKSIGDCGTTTLFIENVSLLAAKAVQDNPLYCGQETSTRYIDFAERHVVDPIGTAESKAVLDRWMSFYAEVQPAVVEHVRSTHPMRAGEKEETYERAVRARAFDVTRGFLPAGVTTQLSWHTNIRQAGDKLASLRHHPAGEMRAVADGLTDLLGEAYPSSAGSTRAAKVTGEKAWTSADDREAWEALVARETAYGFDLGPGTFHDTIDEGLFNWELIESRPRGCVLPHSLNEAGQVTARFFLDFGSFRDVQRHRAGVCRMPLLTMDHGFEGWYLERLPGHVRERAMVLLRQQERATDDLDGNLVDKQYYVPLGYLVECRLTYGLPGLVYLMEARSSKMVHPTLRRQVHRLVERFRARFPDVALHADLDPDDWDVRRGTQTIERR